MPMMRSMQKHPVNSNKLREPRFLYPVICNDSVETALQPTENLSAPVMKISIYTEAWDHLKEVMDRVEASHESVRISLSEADYSGLEETLYLLGNEANAARLLEARQRAPETAVSWEEARQDLDL